MKVHKYNIFVEELGANIFYKKIILVGHLEGNAYGE